ncbi:MAG: glycosyltransferase [Acidobacteriia bacterium]|nr:glycosyltransferase [Terriglobia bacterium]
MDETLISGGSDIELFPHRVPGSIAGIGGPKSRPLQVVFVTIADLPEGGGNTTRVKMLANAVAGRGHQVYLLNEHSLGITPRELLKATGQIGSVEYRYVLGSIERQFGLRSITTKLRAVLALLQAIARRHSRKRIDVLWLNNLSFYDMWPLTKLAQRLGIRTVQSYEDERLELIAPQQSLSGGLLALNGRLADRSCPHRADAIVVISHYLKEKYLSRAAGKTPVHLIPTIVDCNYWAVGPEPVTDLPTLLYAGCFGEQDEMENLLGALAMLRDQGRGFRAVFLGANRDADRVARVASDIRVRGLNTVIEMKGFVPLDQVKSHIANANVMLNIRRDGLWSRSGLSTKLSEYLASGRVVVTTALGDVVRYVEHGKSAILVPPSTTVPQIAAAIDQALVSPQLRDRIGCGGREVARTHFDLRAVGRKLEFVLDTVMRFHPSGADASVENHLLNRSDVMESRIL